jgi:hypothetical protein
MEKKMQTDRGRNKTGGVLFLPGVTVCFYETINPVSKKAHEK